jgi:hypothetical protein
MTPDNCRGFTVHPPTAFYPIPWRQWKLYFDEAASAKTMARLKNSLTIHVWNKFSTSRNITVGSRQPYGLIAQEFCPKVYSHCGPTFWETSSSRLRSRQTCFKLILHAIPLPVRLGGATVAGHSMCHIFFSGKWLLLRHSIYCQVSQAVSLQPLTAEAHIHSQGSNMGTGGRLSFRPSLLSAVLCWLCQI